LRIRINPIDKVVSEYVRKRSGGCCERCGKYYGWKGLQACHFTGRSNHSVRYDEDNLVACDFGCHQYLDSHPLEKVEFFKQRLGPVRFDLLQARARQTGRTDKNALILYYSEKIRQLEVNSGS